MTIITTVKYQGNALTDSFNATTVQSLTLLVHRALKRAWRHRRAWKMKIRAWKNQDPCFNFYKHIYVGGVAQW